MSQSSDPYAIENLIWDCPNCGMKRVQGDVCPNCGTFKDNIKAGPQFKAPVPAPAAAPPSHTQALLPYAGEPAPPLKASSLEGADAPYRDTFRPLAASTMESPVSTETFTTGAFGRKEKTKNDALAYDTFGLPPKAPFLFNQAHAGFAAGTSRQLARYWSGYVFTIIFVIGAIGFFAFSLDQYNFLTALRVRGQTVTGTVTDRYSRVSSGKSSSTSYYVTIQYLALDNRYTVTQSVSNGVYYRLALQQKVPIRYLPENPNRARLSGPYADDTGIEVAFYISIASLIGMGVWLVFWADYLIRQRSLARDGQVIEVPLTSAKLSRNKSTYTLTIRYQFTSPLTGKTLKRRESTIRNDLSKNGAPAAGRTVQLVYLNDRTFRAL
jgi:hypothetical protein